MIGIVFDLPGVLSGDVWPVLREWNQFVRWFNEF